MPTCLQCGGACKRRRKEHPKVFEHRQFCTVQCHAKARREGKLDHLYTPSEKAEMEKKARTLEHGHVIGTVLDPEKVRAIRELSKPLGFSAREIAELKGYKRVTVEAVLSGKTWSSVK